MDTLKLTTASQKAMITDVKAKCAADKSGIRATDALWADGFRSTTFISPGTPAKPNPKSTATKALHDQIGEVIKLGFSEPVQTLLTASTNTLTASGKANKRYWIQQVGARRNDFRRALAKRETPPNRTRTLEERVREGLTTMRKCGKR